MRNILNEWLAAIEFLTRIPVPKYLRRPFDERTVVRSVRWYPYVGLLLGAILAGLSLFFFRWFPAGAAAVLLVVSGIALTGGLHLDGLMDTADGLLSGRDRERKLAIMKDSRVGSMGVIVFVSLFALKGSLLAALGSSHESLHFPILLLMPAIGRIAVVWAIAKYPPARAEGMGAMFAGRVDASQLVTAGLVIIFPIFFWLVKGLVILVITCGFFLWYCRRVNQSLGGLTGDVYGAVCELTEVVFLLVCTVVLV
ncbi:adenosylcobinamide-GDP ribazoletransferase [Effusibacillus lacus]|uniref:Adenosylcobinamide-GDP ribazoletransferase n=1 Tax=Effusibacillus lacus TaxID=1348429 RepID=A0A292YHT3_9BACL|nr:adenosylcobinamide-GDP ribazoletransferase [Effusibacillus lacus]TCS70835.1 cobalamin-5'-phosphate synthase [Effusibacillus lacus]GAX89368.1 adenosylcobinamide-GDP ribazoletransferase [Effusibacillus lacus]